MFRRAAALFALAALAVPGQAAATERPCPGDADYRCSRVTVPVDRAGTVPGKIRLAVARRPARGSTSGVMVFPGGPGAATISHAAEYARLFAPALKTRDLVLLDQRGTGSSGYLDCEIGAGQGQGTVALTQLGKSVERCARKLGPRRAYYTTADNVEDVEAVRESLGLERLVLIGVSYGTRTALAYAEQHPDRVERMVLDSVVPLEGVDPYGLASLRAVPRVLASLCREGGCRGITADPAADLARLVRRIAEEGALRPRRTARFFGCRSRPALTRTALFSYFLNGDFGNAADRSVIPAFVKAGLAGDADPFAFAALQLDETSIIGCFFVELPPGLASAMVRRQEEGARAFSVALNVTTYCEEGPLPWSRSTPPSGRRREAEQGIANLSDDEFAPFDRATALGVAIGSGCRFWPVSGRELPAFNGPLPDVPVLVMGGEDDVRTPLEDSARTAARFRRSKLIVVPNTGHSAIAAPCAGRALKRFFAEQAIGECHRTRRHRPPPTPLDVLRCAAKVLADLDELLVGEAGELPRAGRCERVLDRYLRTLQREM